MLTALLMVKIASIIHVLDGHYQTETRSVVTQGKIWLEPHTLVQDPILMALK